MNPSTKAQGMPGIHIVVGLLGIIALFILLRINLVDIPLERDEGTFGYFGQVINDGGLPYRDALDNKPPGTFYLYAAALQYMEPTARNVHLFAHGYNLLTLLILFAAARLFFQSDGAALWTGLTFAVYTSTWSVEGFAATTEIFMLLPLVLCFWGAVLATSKKHLFWVGFSGAFGALACWTKQVAAFSVLAILLYILVDAWFGAPRPISRGFQKVALSLLIWLLGGLIASLLLLMPFIINGLIPDLFYWVFLHGAAYVQQGGGFTHHLHNVAQWIWEGLPGDTLPLVFGLIAPWFLLRQGRRETLFVTGFLWLSLLGMVPGYQYKHYFIQLGPAVALAVGWSLQGLLSWIAQARLRQAGIFVVGILLVGMPFLTHPGYYWGATPTSISRVFFGTNPFPESIPVADYLRANSDPKDRIFIYGSEPQILFLAERQSASKFVPIYPLFQDFSRHEEFQATAWEELVASKPKYIVATNVPTSFVWDGRASKGFEKKVIKLLNDKYRIVAWVPVGPGKPELRLVATAAPSPFAEMTRHPGYLAIAKRVRE